MEHIIWDPKAECADRQRIADIQLAGLKKTISYCYERSALYKKKSDEIGLRPEHIKSQKISGIYHLQQVTI